LWPELLDDGARGGSSPPPICCPGASGSFIRFMRLYLSAVCMAAAAACKLIPAGSHLLGQEHDAVGSSVAHLSGCLSDGYDRGGYAYPTHLPFPSLLVGNCICPIYSCISMLPSYSEGVHVFPVIWCVRTEKSVLASDITLTNLIMQLTMLAMGHVGNTLSP